MAAKLFELAAALARDRKDKRVPLVPALGRSLRAIGELQRAEEILEEVADADGDAPSRFAFLEVASLRDYTAASAGSFQDLEEAATIDPGEDLDVRARARIVEAELHWTRGRYGAMSAPLDAARRAAEQLDGSEGGTLVNSALGWEARALLLGPAAADQARDRCEKILAEARKRKAHALEASVLAVSAGLHAMLGEHGEARRRYRRSRRVARARGLEAALAALPLYSGPAELLAGRANAARRELRAGYEELERMGDRSRRSTAAAFLAQALCEEHLDDDARRFARRAKALAAADDVYTQVVWRGALAKVLARAEKCDRAVRLAQEAVELAKATDGLSLQGDAYFDQAVVLRQCGRSWTRSADSARSRYAKKGNLAGAERVAQAFGKASS